MKHHFVFEKFVGAVSICLALLILAAPAVNASDPAPQHLVELPWDDRE